jgi:hypothetical protein
MGAWGERSQWRNRLLEIVAGFVLGKRERRWSKRRYNTILRITASHLRGEVAEWSNAAVFLYGPFAPGSSHQLLTGVGGSNPPLSTARVGVNRPPRRGNGGYSLTRRVDQAGKQACYVGRLQRLLQPSKKARQVGFSAPRRRHILCFGL